MKLLGRARAVGAVGDDDVGVGQLRARVVGGDRRVVPLLDVALEDLRDRVGRELQLVDAVDVVADRDRAEQDREVEEVAALDLRLVGVLVRRVGAAEVDRPVGEVLAALARAAAAVVDLDVRVGLRERLDRDLLERFWNVEPLAVERDRAARARRGFAPLPSVIFGAAAVARPSCRTRRAPTMRRGSRSSVFMPGP